LSVRDFRETISSAKRKGIRLKLCPKCGSADVSVLTLTGYITQPIYSCNNCGFQNTIFLEISKEKAEKDTEEEAKVEGEKKE
jgi:uncharacterized Zn finger protein